MHHSFDFYFEPSMHLGGKISKIMLNPDQEYVRDAA
jgi:hypothetical protein